ncbi:glycerophosphodiester phosphodiesterase [Streptococcus pantholopis]|uniref:Glycerophosphodiester phosphodiesterase n=1 Tax=Streptococcus pantholopis TaxID=1811193 RepID=A0A172Q5E4_9STRE|nr:glycerophosphodiester phosphodiesterase [Streptococcus pantholopis]AND78693.1 glycerophosphodiester phosphodiesterase [Streptococcus pantholopis]
MLQTVKDVLRDLYWYKYTYILRAAILQFLLTTAGAYLLSLLFRVILINSGLPGLTADNIFTFFTNPLTLILMPVYLLMLAFLIYVEFSVLAEIIAVKGGKFRQVFVGIKEKARSFFRIVSGWNFLAFVLYLLLSLPILSFFYSSFLLENLYIPKFISGELFKTSGGTYLYYAVNTLFIYLYFRFIYTLPLTVTHNHQSFIQNMKTSWQLTKISHIKNLGGLVLVNLALTGSLILLSLLGIGMAAMLDRSQGNLVIESLFLTFVWGFLFTGSLFMKVGSLDYLLNSLNPGMTSNARPPLKRQSLFLFLLIIAIGCLVYVYNAGQIADADPNKIQILAHRGYVSEGVENSLEALRAAAKAGADYVEMDIIMTKDKEFIVSHDDNLKRLTGENLTISESKAADLVGLPIKQNGFSSHLVTFSTYVEEAKKLGVKLLVELKPSGKEPADYEEIFLARMKELGVSQDYKVMSMSLSTMERIESLNPAVETGYVIPLQLGQFTTHAVDFYALEEFSYREASARAAKKQGKEIYVWTINSENEIDKYLQSGVTGIITDYPELVKEEKKMIATEDSYVTYFLRLLNLS